MKESKKKKGEMPVHKADGRPVEERGTEAAPLPEGASETEELRRRAAEFEDKWLRAVADLDNFRKRIARDRERDLWSARAGVTIPMIEVLDDFERALAGGGDGDDGVFRKGVEMIRYKFESVLEGIGVKGFVSMGEPFDPERHDALQSVPTADVPEGHVAAEIRRGYLFGDRVLRPALVAVATAVVDEAGEKDRNETSPDE